MVTNDLDGKPFQLKFVRTAQMNMFADILCEPPLGQTTVVAHNKQLVRRSGQEINNVVKSFADNGEINFTVLIESSRSFPLQSWEASIWHNGHDDRKWDELPLTEVTETVNPLSVSSNRRSSSYSRYFSGKLLRPSVKAPVNFTFKFRTSRSESWIWANDHLSQSDGEILFQSTSLPKNFDECMRESDQDFSVQAVDSEVSETHVWEIISPIEAAKGKSSTSRILRLGLPLDFTRWFALVRIWSPWLAPRHGGRKYSPSEDAVMSAFLREDGLHLVLLALSGIEDVLTVLKPDDNGNVMVSSRNDGTKKSHSRIIAAIGYTFETANAAVMYHARSQVSGDQHMSKEIKAEIKASIDHGIKAEWMENWYDGLTYCTWNALGQDLNQEKIYNALDVLDQNNIKIMNLIIDDNWQSLDKPGESQFKRGWTRFDANSEGFPKGLKHTVSKIRSKHPNIRHIAVWHAILGYWGGVSPDGEIAKNYKTKEVRKAEGLAGGTFTVVVAEDAQRMYDDFYKFLREAGIDSVKTDAQFFLDLLDDADDRRSLIKAYQDAWTISSLRFFSIKAISCMSQVPQILFHSQLPTNKPRLMVRNSDDFFPEIPSSHPWHIFTNAHNSLLTSHLNILPDWDMFQTSHPYSSFHAAGRCLSGGPIYITDEPGQHDIGLISTMTAQTPQEKTVILRPDVIGKSTAVYTSYDEEKLLKVGTYHGSQGTGTSILGVFDVSERPLLEFVNLAEFPGVEDDKEYVVRAHSTEEVSKPLRTNDTVPLISVQIEVKGWEILSAYPLSTFTTKGNEGEEGKETHTKIAVLGLMEKMTGAAAVVRKELKMEGNGRIHVSVGLKALGYLGIYISSLRNLSIADNFLITIRGRVIPSHTVTKCTVSDTSLIIDVETAWREMEIGGGWSNEVGVEIFIH